MLKIEEQKMMKKINETRNKAKQIAQIQRTNEENMKEKLRMKEERDLEI